MNQRGNAAATKDKKMARTNRNYRTPCANLHTKEGKFARKSTARALRRATRNTVRDIMHGHVDFAAAVLPRRRGTEGRLSH